MIQFFMQTLTINEAVSLILSEMSGREKLIVRNTKKEDLIKLHLTWGNKIRNRLGLWNGNNALFKDAQTDHPDSVTSIIMNAVWDELQKG